MNDRWQITTIGFLLCLGGGFAASVLGLSGITSRAEPDRSGQSVRSIDRKIDQSIAWAAPLNALLAGLEYKFLNDAGELVRPGCKDWLFLAEELRAYPGGDANLEKRLEIARGLIRKLTATHVTLVVLPVPDKSDLARDALCGAAVSDQAKQRKNSWRVGMRAESVRQVELASNWPRPGFLRTDSHWDMTGAQYAARQLAAVIIDAIGKQATKVALIRHGPVARAGDLIRLADLQSTYRWSGPPADRVSSVVADVKFSGGLLDRPGTPRIVLAGSSFSLNSSFLDFLQSELQEPVLQMSKEGAGFAGALFALLRENAAMLKSVKIVVWEFPLRALTPPLTPEEERFLE